MQTSAFTVVRMKVLCEKDITARSKYFELRNGFRKWPFNHHFPIIATSLINHLKSTQPAFTCSKWIMKTPEQYKKSVQSYQNQVQRRPSDVFNVNFEQISPIVLVFSLLTLKKQCHQGLQVSCNLYNGNCGQ